MNEVFGCLQKVMVNDVCDVLQSASGGLRGNIMRTPGQRQQNFTLEGMINEADASAKVDPIQFRLDHTTDQRLIDILNATAKAAAWEPRPSRAVARAGLGLFR